MNRPVRKAIRLEGYDYSRNGAYFVTVCTKNKMCIFWDKNDKYRPLPDKTDLQDKSVGTAIGRPDCNTGKIHLSEYGRYVRQGLMNIHEHYPMVYVDKYVIMPNHIHMILRIDVLSDFDGRPMAVPTISQAINQFKGWVSKRSGFHVWQGRFHDRILRNEREYTGAWQYIENNPINWQNDKYYVE
ncbi:MAG: hypothetical protein IJK31_05600 [Ruminococcus sp.]|nr:hypothetical protein [Ruminococcus sp.]HRR75363.1 hypothetical protein [Ruminococcus sp.]